MKRIAWLPMLVLLLATMVVPTRVAANPDVPQPHMRAALEHLRAARAELDQAEHNKGGHRVKAIKLVDDAIGQVREGIEAGNH